MDAGAELTLKNLHVIAALSQNDKLNTNEDSFDIYVPTTLRGLVRTWYREGRGHNVERVRSTVRAGVGYVTRSLEEMRTFPEGDDVSMQLRRDTCASNQERMFAALLASRHGTRNLMQTYREDAALTAQLRLLIEEIDAFERVVMRSKTAPARSIAAGGSAPQAAPRTPPSPLSPRVPVAPIPLASPSASSASSP